MNFKLQSKVIKIWKKTKAIWESLKFLGLILARLVSRVKRFHSLSVKKYFNGDVLSENCAENVLKNSLKKKFHGVFFVNLQIQDCNFTKKGTLIQVIRRALGNNFQSTSVGLLSICERFL